MSWLPESASFEERVHDCFSAFRGGGVMLNALDVELAGEWAQTGVPFELVARGIQKAAERKLWDARPGEPALRSLRACRREVEGEISRWKALSAGERRSAPKSDRKAVRALVALKAERPELASSIDQSVTELSEPGCDRARSEQRVLLRLARRLPWAERVGVVRTVRERIAALPGLSALARRNMVRFHICAAVRKTLSLPSFW